MLLTGLWQQVNAEAAFTSFVRVFKKEYKSEQEHNERLNVFKANVAKISANNAQNSASFKVSVFPFAVGALSSAGLDTDMQLVYPTQMDLNEFADLTWEEFSSTHLGLLPGQDGTFRRGPAAICMAAPVPPWHVQTCQRADCDGMHLQGGSGQRLQPC
jgi:hypothetical protein